MENNFQMLINLWQLELQLVMCSTSSLLKYSERMKFKMLICSLFLSKTFSIFSLLLDYIIFKYLCISCIVSAKAIENTEFFGKSWLVSWQTKNLKSKLTSLSFADLVSQMTKFTKKWILKSQHTINLGHVTNCQWSIAILFDRTVNILMNSIQRRFEKKIPS